MGLLVGLLCGIWDHSINGERVKIIRRLWTNYNSLKKVKIIQLSEEQDVGLHLLGDGSSLGLKRTCLRWERRRKKYSRGCINIQKAVYCCFVPS